MDASLHAALEGKGDALISYGSDRLTAAAGFSPEFIAGRILITYLTLELDWLLQSEVIQKTTT